MPREVIRTVDSWEELGQFIHSGADREPYAEVPFRNMNGEPMTPEEVLDLARQIERETGQRLFFRRRERRGTG